ncbi:MAG TPA: hypothetical protein VLA51_12490, partial [Paracoccaceae bacterium]|nr:hypothetical protein [Paracoccaceae bacterium]
GTGVLFGGGVFMVMLAASTVASNFVAMIPMLLIGAGMLWLAWRYWNATSSGLIFTGAGLFRQDGTLIIPAAAIEDLDRTTFGFRPTNGFVLKLNRPVGRAWQPGVYWSYGKSFAVGGANSKVAGKAFGDGIVMYLVEKKAAEKM